MADVKDPTNFKKLDETWFHQFSVEPYFFLLKGMSSFHLNGVVF